MGCSILASAAPCGAASLPARYLVVQHPCQHSPCRAPPCQRATLCSSLPARHLVMHLLPARHLVVLLPTSAAPCHAPPASTAPCRAPPCHRGALLCSIHANASPLPRHLSAFAVENETLFLCLVPVRCCVRRPISHSLSDIRTLFAW